MGNFHRTGIPTYTTTGGKNEWFTGTPLYVLVVVVNLWNGAKNGHTIGIHI
jgi:hypothetical protein